MNLQQYNVDLCYCCTTDIHLIFLIVQGELKYELVGVYPAQDFFTVDPDTAEVKVRKPLAQDSLRSVEYLVRVTFRKK